MQFVLVLAVLAALVIAENTPAQPVSGVGPRLLLAALGMTGVALFAAVSSGLIANRLKRDFQHRSLLLRRFRNLRRLHVVLWLGVAGGILYGLGWAQLVRFNWHLDHAFLVDDVLILLPVVLPLVLSWAAFYEVDHAVRVGLAGHNSLEVLLSTRRQYLMLHLRHYLGILLLPVLGLLAVQDAAELLVPGSLHGPYAPAIYLPPIVLLFLLLPVLLRRVWETWPLEAGPLRNRLEATAGRAGFRAREILVWHTNRMIVNAAVAGFLPRLRYVFLTDGLLAQLNEEEVEAVFGHEVGHVRHHHLLLRVLAMAAPLSLWLLLQQVLPRSIESLEDWLAQAGPGLQLPLGLVLLAGIALYMLVVFGAYSRLLEGQADLFSCRTLAADPASEPIATFVAALEKLAAASGVDRNAPSWQHASIGRRVEFLERVAGDPKFELRFQRRVRWLSRLLIGVVISPVAYQLLLG